MLRTAGLEAESALAFAALHRLLRPALDRLAALPAPQRRALRVAFGEEEGDRLDPFLVALGTLSLLTELSESGPVLCLVDDLQWLDAASRDALLFVARRLLAEPVAIVFAARDDDTRQFLGPTDIAELPLAALAPTAVRSLLEERAGASLPDQVVDELAARTGGNPLAVVEAPTQLSAGQLTGTDSLPHDLPLSARMERTFLDRCRRLSQHAQTLMLLAAADDSLHHAELRRAGGALGVAEDAFAEVEGSGLLRVDGDLVRVRHPLVRSAIYQAATASERRAAHAALAELSVPAPCQCRRPVPTVDRRTWHRRCGGRRPRRSRRRTARGRRRPRREPRRPRGCLVGLRTRRPAQHPDDLRAHRLFTAARNAYAAGRTERAEALLTAARPVADERPLRAAIDRLRGRIEVAAGSAVDAHRIFLTAARDVAEVESGPGAGDGRVRRCAAQPRRRQRRHAGAGNAVAPDIEPDDPPRVRCLKLLLETTDREAVHDWGGAITALRTALSRRHGCRGPRRVGEPREHGAAPG